MIFYIFYAFLLCASMGFDDKSSRTCCLIAACQNDASTDDTASQKSSISIWTGYLRTMNRWWEWERNVWKKSTSDHIYLRNYHNAYMTKDICKSNLPCKWYPGSPLLYFLGRLKKVFFFFARWFSCNIVEDIQNQRCNKVKAKYSSTSTLWSRFYIRQREKKRPVGQNQSQSQRDGKKAFCSTGKRGEQSLNKGLIFHVTIMMREHKGNLKSLYTKIEVLITIYGLPLE